MVSLTVPQIRDLIQEAITGKNREVIESHAGLSWMLPELESQRDALDTVIVGRPADTTLEVLRAEASPSDKQHDDEHRHLYYLLRAGLYTGTPEQRAAVAHTLSVLYPEGLRAVRATYRQEVVNTTAFASRLERPDVQAGLDAVDAYAKRIYDQAADCVRAGEALAEVMRRIDEAEVAAAARPADREQILARASALSTWSTFVTNVEHVLAGTDEATTARREGLLKRWRELKAEAARPAPAESDTPAEGDAPVDADVTEPEPELV